jgi:hypothetical protein
MIRTLTLSSLSVYSNGVNLTQANYYFNIQLKIGTESVRNKTLHPNL